MADTIGRLREGGPFAIETYSTCTRTPDHWYFRQTNYTVVYADRGQPSHCQWMVPGTYEEDAAWMIAR